MIRIFLKKTFMIFKEPYYILAGTVRFVFDLVCFCRKNRNHSSATIKAIIPIVKDRYVENGYIDKHYFLQDIYVASKVIENKPARHYDIGSRVDGFIGHLLAAFQGEITLIDIRPLPVAIDKLHFVCADATKLENVEDCSIESLSSLHAVEHFGLGRYGDPVDPQACYAAMKSIQRVLRGGGVFVF